MNFSQPYSLVFPIPSYLYTAYRKKMTFTPETTREEVAELLDSLGSDSQVKLYDWNYEAPDLDPGAHIIIRKVTEGFQWQRFNTGWFADWGFRDRDDLIDIVHNNRDNPDADLKVVKKEG